MPPVITPDPRETEKKRIIPTMRPIPTHTHAILFCSRCSIFSDLVKRLYPCIINFLSLFISLQHTAPETEMLCAEANKNAKKHEA